MKWPGSTHDSFILRNSLLWNTLEQNPHRGIILGDSAYPCRYWLMVPFRNATTPTQKAFNTALTKTRVKIENAFGQLKRRFSVLQQKNRRRLDNVMLDIGACFVLHNLAKQWNEPDEVYQEEQDDEVDQPGIADNVIGTERRLRLANRIFAAQ